jgi:hypothetical protein
MKVKTGSVSQFAVRRVSPCGLAKRRPSALKHGPQQFAPAGPQDLHAETEQDERGQAHRDVGRALADEGLDAVGVGERQKDGRGDDRDGRQAGNR